MIYAPRLQLQTSLPHGWWHVLCRCQRVTCHQDNGMVSSFFNYFFLLGI